MKKSVFIIAASAFLFGCTVENDYKFNPSTDIDPTITIFSNGVDFPLGNTEKIYLADALDLISEPGIKDLVKKDAQGNYSISTEGQYSFNEVLADLDLKKLNDINGVSFTNAFEYDLGAISSDNFSLSESKYDVDLPAFASFNLNNVVLSEISSGVHNVNTDIYKYLTSDLDLTSKLPNVNHPEKLFSISEVSPIISMVPVGNDVEISVQTFLNTQNYSNITIAEYKEHVTGHFSPGENSSKIKNIDNFKLKSGGKMKVKLSVKNCALTSGSVTPAIKLDISEMLKIDGAGVDGSVDLSTMVMNPSNNWEAEKEFAVSGLASAFPEYNGGVVKIDRYISLSGDVKISDAKTTKSAVSALATKDMQLVAEVSFENLYMDSMDITLDSGVGIDFDPVNIPVEYSFDIPKEVKSVKKILFDQSVPLKLEMSASSIAGIKSADGSKHLSIVPEIEISFPQWMSVKGAVNNKIVVSGDLYDGKLTKDIIIESITPTMSGNALSINGKVSATVNAVASGTFNTKNLPKNAAEDVIVSACISGTPKVKDYEAVLDVQSLSSKIEENKVFEMEMNGIGDFGTFKVYPKTPVSLSLNVKLPELTEISLIANKIKVSLPDIFEFDAKSVSGFDSSKNLLTIDGTIPPSINLPVKCINIKPVKEGGKTLVRGEFKISGSLDVNGSDITNKTFNEVSKSASHFGIVVPKMEAGTISMDGDFDKPLDYECKDITILDKSSIASFPKELLEIKNIDFKDVNAIVKISLSDLPSGADFTLRNTCVELPEFLVAKDGGNVLHLDETIPVSNGVAVVTKAALGGIKNVNLDGLEALKGDISLTTSLFASNPSIDVSTLKDKIKGTVVVAVGNGATVNNPGKIQIAKAVVKAKYDISSENKLKLGEIPENLQTEDVNLSLSPELSVNLRTNFGAPIKGAFEIVPVVKGTRQEQNKVVIEGIQMPVSDDASKSAEAKYLISANPQVDASGTVPIACDLSPLLKTIPDELVLTVNAGISSSDDCVVFPDAEYTCDMDYKLNVPLSFGEDMSVKISSIIDMDANIGGYLELVGKILLNMDIVNTLPVGVCVEAKLIDDTDKEIKTESPVKLDIKPGDGSSTSPQHHQLVLDFGKTNDLNLKQIRLAFSIDATKDVPVTSDQYIQVTKLSVSIPEGVVISIKK